MAPITVAWQGAFFRYHSLALVNRELTLALSQRGEVSLYLKPAEPDQFAPSDGHRLAALKAMIDRPKPKHINLEVRHLWPPRFDRPEADRLVLIQPWEFGSVPRHWVEAIDSVVDELWVPTTWVRWCYVSSGIAPSKVRVIPNGVDVVTFRPDASPMQLPTSKSFIFLFVGGLIARKGVDLLLRAYTTAFRRTDDVCLVIKDYGQQGPYNDSALKNQILAACADKRLPQIVYLNQDIPTDDMPSLYTACNCLVHPYRGEGFGLPIAEAMACGRPVITTNYGAALDFCDSERAYLIPARVRYLETPMVGDLATVGLPWLAEPDWQALAWTMRRVYDDPAEAENVGKRARAFVVNNLTWDHAADRALARIKALAA